MTELVDNQIVRKSIKAPRGSTIVVAAVALLFGTAGGLLYGRGTAIAAKQEKGGAATNEIIVSNAQGLIFKSQDGTPLMKIGKDEWGGYVHVLASDGTSIVELNNVRDTGNITVGSKGGGLAHMAAHENSATISLIGKYGKQVIEITSATPDGGGNISISEGRNGNQAVQIGSGPNRSKSKGSITISGNEGADWKAP